MKKLFRLGAIAAACLALASAHAADWSDTEVQLLRGTSFRDNGDTKAQEFGKTIVTLNHVSGYKYGSNFFFVDFIRSDDGGSDNGASEVYGEYYHTLSLGKVGGLNWSKNFVKDIGLSTGINWGDKNSAFGPNPRVFLVGPSVDLALPGFAFFNLAAQAYIDRGRFSGFGGGKLCGSNSTGVQVTPAWNLPFSLGSAKFEFSGFLDWITSHGSCSAQVLTQPQIRWDVGNHFGKAGTVFLGVEYQYWHNKFGINGLTETFPQALLVWKL